MEERGRACVVQHILTRILCLGSALVLCWAGLSTCHVHFICLSRNEMNPVESRYMHSET